MAAGIARYGERLPGLLAAELQRNGLGAGQLPSAPTTKQHFQFAKHPGERTLTDLPVGATYQIGDGPRWKVIEHAALRGAS